LRLPEEVLVRAEERVPKTERDVNALLADLERRDGELGARERAASEALEDARSRGERIADRERTVREREKELEKTSRQEARRYLLEARSEIERTIKELKRAGADQVDEVARGARQKAERMAGAQGEALRRLEARDRGGRGASAPEPVQNGDWVELASLGGKPGRVVELRAGSAVVAVGGMKLTVPAETLVKSRKEAPKPEVVVPILGDTPEIYAQREIDLRGMRVNEVDEIVLQALDAAVRADLKEVHIIHGKGTGALRERVTEMLRKESRVSNFRLGAWNEGGAGVTVVEIG
jgi:DNA mismatch repair protein MutS2